MHAVRRYLCRAVSTEQSNLTNTSSTTIPLQQCLCPSTHPITHARYQSLERLSIRVSLCFLLCCKRICTGSRWLALPPPFAAIINHWIPARDTTDYDTIHGSPPFYEDLKQVHHLLRAYAHHHRVLALAARDAHRTCRDRYCMPSLPLPHCGHHFILNA